MKKHDLMKSTSDNLDLAINNIELRDLPEDQVRPLLDIVSFNKFLEYTYLVLLKRKPDRAGRIHYNALVDSGLPRAAVVKQLLRSFEYRSTSIEASGLSIDDFVNRVYQDVLGRWPDQNGLETYRRTARRLNGRRKIVAALRKSDEAIRKGGGRLARISGLRAYARAGWPLRLAVIGPWFAQGRARRQRLDRIELSQRYLAREVATLRQELNAASLEAAPLFGFLPEDHEAKGRADAIFHDALTRARREI